MPVLSRHTPSNIGSGLIITPADMDSGLGPVAPNDSHPNTPLVVVAVSVAGYLIFGLIVAVFFNDDTFSFLPPWYRRSQRTLSDKGGLVLWYLGIMVFWAFIVPLYLVCGFVRWSKGLRRRKTQRRKRTKEASPGQDRETESISQTTISTAEKWVEIN